MCILAGYLPNIQPLAQGNYPGILSDRKEVIPGSARLELRINWATAVDCGLISDDLGKVGGDKKLRMLFGRRILQWMEIERVFNLFYSRSDKFRLSDEEEFINHNYIIVLR